MDILIKGERIELPKVGESYIDIRIYETGEIVIDGDQDKTAMAVELPPHGDLIDRKELLNWNNITCVDTGCWQYDYDAVKVSVIKKAPVVLEATK